MEERQYALTHNGALVIGRDGAPVVTGFMAAKPDDYSSFHPAGCVWLPVENVDSQPFEARTCARVGHTFEVRADRVLRVFEILRRA